LFRLETGRFSTSQPGVARFNIDSPRFWLSAEIFNEISQELDVVVDYSTGRISEFFVFDFLAKLMQF
jgi:hypothetical protein